MWVDAERQIIAVERGSQAHPVALIVHGVHKAKPGRQIPGSTSADSMSATVP